MSERTETVVLRGASIPNFGTKIFGGTIRAWSEGHALEEKEELEYLVRKIADGHIDEIEEAQAACAAIMEKQGWA